jgi:iron complex transport system substrate-binding protein
VNRPKKYFSLFVFVLLTSMLAACAAPAVNTVSPPTAEPAAVEPTTIEPTLADSATAEPVTPTETTEIVLTDVDGNTVTLPQHPQRIVVAGKATPYVLDTLYLFPDAAQKLTALEVRGFDTQAFLSLVDPDVEVKNTIERDAGAEQIAPYDPDLVILKSFSVAKMAPPLNQIGIPVLGLNLETPEFFYQDIQLIGQILDDETRAEEIINFYQQRVTKVEEQLSTLDREEKPTVLVLQYTEDGGEVAFKVPPENYLQTILVKMAGGDPVWLDEVGTSDNWMVVGLEQIAAWNADMVFVVQYNGDSTATSQKIAEDANWQNLDAVKNEQIFGFPADHASWDLIDPRWILGLQWLTETINPELEANFDLQQEVVGFYQQMYRLSETQIETEILPKLDELAF